jgi:hypothetical protein
MLEWFAVGLPVGLTALVFSLALTTDPNHVEVRSLTTSESAEARGYSAERLAIQLGNDIQHIVQVASTHHQPKSIEVGIADEPVEHLVDYFDLSPFVEAVQEYIGGVLYFTDIALVDDEMGDPLLDINVRRIENTQIVFADAIETKNGRIDDAVKTAAEIIVKITEPYIYASYLHNVYKHGKEKQSLYELIDFLKITLPPATNDEKIWYFNLLGIASYETGRYDIAIGFYQEAPILIFDTAI